MKGKLKITQIIRHIIQLIAFILFPGLFVSTFGALKDVYMAVIGGDFSISEYSEQIILLIAVLPITALFGRFFCGFLCSFGAMGELLSWISSKIIKKPVVIGEKADRVLKWLKYVVLALNVVLIWTLSVSADSSDSPWNVFGMYSTYVGWTDLTAWISVGGVLLLLIIVGDFLVERFFCRYLCPLGAVFSILSKLRLMKNKKRDENCGNCQMCSKKCSMGISLNKTNNVKSGECINCYKCVDSCPRGNMTSNPVPAVAGTVAVVGMTGLFCVGSLAIPNLEDNSSVGSIVSADTNEALNDFSNVSAEDAETSEESVSDGKYKDGVYVGEATGFRGKMNVEVTVENGLISSIEVVSSRDDAKYLNRAVNKIIPDIINNQSVEVEAVSGATFSSKGIINAVSNALEKGFSIEEAVSSSDAETSKPSDSEVSENFEEASKEESNKKPVKDESQSDVENSQSGSDKASELDLSAIEDGEYQGSGSGFRGNTAVSVKVENHKIVSITIESYRDDRKYFDRAKERVVSGIISSQSLEVEAVSGATFSSNGIIEAVANALNVSFTNPNGSMGSNGHKPPRK